MSNSVQAPGAQVVGERVSLHIKVAHFLKEMEMTDLRTRLKMRGGASLTWGMSDEPGQRSEGLSTKPTC